MGKTYTVTVDVKCWKEHECCVCGGRFRYLFERKMKGQGGTEAKAAANADAAVVKAIKHDLDLRPCPSCGLLQPDMIGSWRSGKHKLVLILGVVAFLGAFILGGVNQFWTHGIFLWMAALAGLGTLLGHAFVEMRRFNSDLEGNREQSRDLVKSGKLVVSQEGDERTIDDPETFADKEREHLRQASPRWIYVMMLLALAVISSAELARLALGWPVNPDWHPAIAGPGDSTYVWFPQRINNVKNLWSGSAQAQALNSAELGLVNPTIQAETGTDHWGDSISVKTGEKSTNSSPWARITVPNIANPEGKTLRVGMDLTIRYPSPEGNGFTNRQDVFSHNADLVLAEAGAGTTYLLLYWLAGLGGLTLLCFGSLILILRAGSLKKRALPNEVIPIADDGPRRPRVDEDDDEPEVRRRRDTEEDDKESERRRRRRSDDDDEPIRDRP
jgi:hypothetical protein